MQLDSAFARGGVTAPSTPSSISRCLSKVNLLMGNGWLVGTGAWYAQW